MIDLWLELVDRTRDEILQDKKFWAFLNGYLNLKMSMLLENQHSIIESTIQMFISKDLQSSLRASQSKKDDIPLT